jgi:hypothetical protein
MKTKLIVPLLILVLAVLGSSQLMADSSQKPLICGKASITATHARFQEGRRGEDFAITVKIGSQKKVFRYSNENDFLKLRCQADKNRQSMLLVNHTCGGTGCAESNFGIIDLQTLDVLLKPDSRWKGNHTKAEAILGVKIKPFSCNHFDGLQTNGDYCYDTMD